jgi:hypothetical protein
MLLHLFQEEQPCYNQLYEEDGIWHRLWQAGAVLYAKVSLEISIFSNSLPK